MEEAWWADWYFTHKIFLGQISNLAFQLKSALFSSSFSRWCLSPSWPAASSHHLYILLSHPPTKTQQTHSSSSTSLTPSPVNQPSTTACGRFHRRTLLETPYAPLSQTLKVKLLTVLVAFQVVVRFLSNLSYMSDIHVIEYMGFWFGGFIC